MLSDRDNMIVESLRQQLEYNMLSEEEIEQIYTIMVKNMQGHMDGGH